MKYSVKRYWEVCDTVDVEAENVEEAIEIATELGLTTGEYVMDSSTLMKRMYKKPQMETKMADTPKYIEDIHEITWEMLETIRYGRLPGGVPPDADPVIENKLYEAIYEVLCEYYGVSDYRHHL